MKRLDVITEKFPDYMSLLNTRLQNDPNSTACLKTFKVLQLRPSALVRFDRLQYHKHLNTEIQQESVAQHKLTYQGEMTSCGKKNIEKTVNVWFEALSFNNANVNIEKTGSYRKLIFVTLTLSSTQIHSDKIIKSGILKPFLRIMREKHECDNYLWKAEPQGNGNIHFHVIFDRYIDKEQLTEIWNNCQKNFGYLDNFTKTFGHEKAPSTHVEVVKGNSVSAYISKYITKGSAGKRPIEGAVWHKSKALQDLRYFEVEEEFSNSQMIEKEFEVLYSVDHSGLVLEFLVHPTKDVFSCLSKFQRYCYLNYLRFIHKRIFGSDFEEFYSTSFFRMKEALPAPVAHALRPTERDVQEARQLHLNFTIV